MQKKPRRNGDLENFLTDNRAFPAFGTHEPVGPYRHALDLAIGQAGTLDHPANVILVINLDVALGPVAERRKPSANPFIDCLWLYAFLGGKRLRAILAQVGLGLGSLGTARHDAEKWPILHLGFLGDGL